MQHKDPSSTVFKSFVCKSLISLTIAPVLLTAMVVATRYDQTLAQAPAAAPTFSLPDTLPNGTTVKLDGSSSMTATNDDLKKRFEEKFPGSVISLSSNGTDAALQALQKGEIDLAAIGRPLTEAEKAQGLTEAPMSREKIAIIVGPANPYKGSITDDQFVRVFRGEIKNWSELGGPNVPIRVIDRPASSDTRQSLSRYPGFNSGPMQPGANATSVPQDDTDAVIKELGSDGIGYAIASQVLNRPDVSVLLLHGILPTDPRYAYSQPRNYVYKGQPNPGVAAFLGITAITLGQEAVPPANPQGTAAIPGGSAASPPPAPAATSPAAVTPPTTAPVPEQEGGFDLSSLWWLLIPLLGIPLLLWLLKGRGGAAPAAVATTQSGRMILVARNCRDAYAYWEIPSETFAAARHQGGRDLKVRLHDVTDVPDLDWQASQKVQEFPCSENAQDLHIPVDVDDRTYAAELGYVTDTGEWLRIAHSDPVHVPACTPNGSGVRTAATVAAGGAVAAGVAAARTSQPATPVVPPPPVPTEPRRFEPKRITMVPRSDQDAYVYWDVPDADKTALRAQGGRKLMLRVHDVTGRDLEQQGAHSVRQYECDEIAWDKHIPLVGTDLAGNNVAERDYVAELGYVTDDNRWLSLVRSDVVHVAASTSAPEATPATTNLATTNPETDPLDAAARLAATSFTPGTMGEPSHPLQDAVKSVTDRVSGAIGNVSTAGGDARSVTNRLGDAPGVTGDAVKATGATLAGGAAAVAGASPTMKTLLDRSQATGQDRIQQAPDCRITLEPRGNEQAYVSWEVAEAYRQALRDRGGRQLTLRIYDATNIDIDYNQPHSTQTYVCNETDHDKLVAIPVADRDYIADLGYFTDDNRWLRLIRSVHVHVPSNQ